MGPHGEQTKDLEPRATPACGNLLAADRTAKTMPSLSGIIAFALDRAILWESVAETSEALRKIHTVSPVRGK